MTHAATILLALLATFVLFVAAKQRLGVYTAALWGPAPPTPGSGSSGGMAGANQSLTQGLGVLQNVPGLMGL